MWESITLAQWNMHIHLKIRHNKIITRITNNKIENLITIYCNKSCDRRFVLTVDFNNFSIQCIFLS